MKILFDTQIFDWQISGGISRYFIELINRLDNDPDEKAILHCIHSYNTYIQNTRWLKAKPQLKRFNFKGKLSIVKAINQIINRRFSNNYLKAGEQDIFHPTYYDPYFLKYIGKKPFVLTVHDLTNEKFPDGTTLTKKILNWRNQLIFKADHIIAISENTKNDITAFYKIDPAKITTIHHAGSFDVIPAEIIKTKAAKEYLLFVGSRRGYKNFTHLATEVSSLLHKYDLNLLVAGGGSLTIKEIALLKKLNIYDRVVAFSHLNDGHLAQLYKNALVFIFPSLYEGFGLPVLEAMQCECPVLLSNNSSLPEVGGSAAAYFDPFAKGSLGERLQQLINSEEERKRMVIAGFEQVKQFNWDITAKQHIEVYKKVYYSQF